MKLLNLNSPQDIMALLVRRKWWIVFPFLAFSCAALLLTYMLPRMYVSEALVLVQQRDIPDDFVKDLLAGSTDQRLSSVKQNVLRRTNLIEIVREFEAGMPEYQNLDLDQKILALNNQIELTPRVDDSIGNGRLPVTYFRISYRNRNPEIAQKITAKLTDMFIKQDNLTREAKVSEATTFLSNELEKISSQLNESNTKLKNLKASRRDSLPSQTPTNLSQIERLEGRRTTDYGQLAQAQIALTNLDQFLNITPEKIPGSKPAPVAAAPPVVKDPLVEEYLTAQKLKAALLAKGLTEKHPDVLIYTNQLERLKAQIGPEALAAALVPKEEKTTPLVSQPEMVTNPQYLTLMAQKKTIEGNMELVRKDIAEVEDRIKGFDVLVRNAPQSEQDLADVLRENIDLNKQYEEMKGNLSKAQLSESLESNQQGSALRISEGANLPLSATKPAKGVLAGVGMMISLLAGIAIAVIVDVANQKMWTLSEIETLLGTTVLVEIPEIVTPADLIAARRKRRLHLASFVVLSAAYGFCLYFAYIHQSFVLSHLEPVIKRLY